MKESSAQPASFEPTGEVVVALDTIGAAKGHLVVVTWGSGARAVFQAPDNRDILADAAVARIIDAYTFKTTEVIE